MRRSRGGLLFIVVLTVMLGAPGAAHAYVYWSDNTGTTIGRANLDGTGVDPNFITGASGPLAVVVDGQQIYWANHANGTIGVANLDGSSPDQQLIAGASGVDGLAIAGSSLYWANYDTSAIGEANLDGSGANEDLFAATSPGQLAISGQYIYWVNLTGTIGRADLDGSGADQSFITGASKPYGVAVNGGYIYWSNYATGTIGRANLDGSDPDQDFITGADYPVDLALDSQHLYWTNIGDGTIGRANLDGSDPDQDFITGAADAYGLAVDAGAPPPPAVPPMTFGTATTLGAGASLSATCSGSAGPTCAGTVTVTEGKKPVTIASVPYSIAAGASETLRVALNATGRRLLASHYKLAAQLTVTGTGSLAQLVTFAYARIRFSVAYTWLFAPGYTTVRQLTVSGVPANVRFEVICHGGGCPFARHTIRHPRRRLRLAPLFARHRLAPGARVELAASAPDEVGDVLILTVRRDNTPSQKVRCLPPGFRRPAACA